MKIDWDCVTCQIRTRIKSEFEYSFEIRKEFRVASVSFFIVRWKNGTSQVYESCVFLWTKLQSRHEILETNEIFMCTNWVLGSRLHWLPCPLFGKMMNDLPLSVRCTYSWTKKQKIKSSFTQEMLTNSLGSSACVQNPQFSTRRTRNEFSIILPPLPKSSSETICTTYPNKYSTISHEKAAGINPTTQ